MASDGHETTGTCRSPHSLEESGTTRKEQSKLFSSMKYMLSNIYPPLKTRLNPEHMLYNAGYMGLLLYGFMEISHVSKKAVSQLGVDPPKWSVLQYPVLGSVGYDGSSDAQWRSIDHGFTALMLSLGLFASGARIIRLVIRKENIAFLLQCYYVVFGLFFFGYLHGPRCCTPLILILLNYFLTKFLLHLRVHGRLFIAWTWILHTVLVFVVGIFRDRISIGPKYLDWWPAIMSWTPIFNMSILRMISFNVDMHEAFTKGAESREMALQRHSSSCLDCAKLRELYPNEEHAAVWCYKLRMEYPRHPSEYNLLGYMAYMLYTPLYIGGPMSSFNAFISHCWCSSFSMTKEEMLAYATYVAIIYVTLVTMLHFLFLNAFRNNPGIVKTLDFHVTALMMYYTLIFLWLKFSLIWKTARLAAFVDGVEVPEDLPRCIGGSKSIREFWREWHASFNLWIVRYMYIPLGGSRGKYLSIIPIFFFIAIWHDVELHLMEWAGCTVLFFSAELLVSMLWDSSYCTGMRKWRHERYLRYAAGSLCTLALIVSNVIGFSTYASRRDTQTNELIFNGLMSASPTFYLFCILFVYCISASGTILRDEEAVENQRLRKLYGVSGSHKGK
ncbi:putative MBOAT membrane bound O acyltransferase family [Trypanosoma vivax]|uniref:Putative glycerol uptake protein n=1 Tax=Trypanosoma vivax (strain Y486) TaxID=1055687 RepID=G0U4X5_TRYVY|nr:putative MBOAT membrane bound O acyltransferase family [Trypanosoma vivax]CCC52490.1 putative glycerol uptake protein [Trypanosoma vivax Y486]